MGGDENRDAPARWRRPVPDGLLRAGVVCGSVLLVAATVLLVGWVLVRLAPVTLAVMAALLLTALLAPAVDGLTRLRLPRAVASLAVVLGLLAALVLPVALIGQQAATQFDDLGARLDDGVTRVRDWIVAGPLPVTNEQLDQVWRQARDAALDALPGPATGATAAVEILGAAALALLLLFFLLKDGPLMWRWLLRRGA